MLKGVSRINKTDQLPGYGTDVQRLVFATALPTNINPVGKRQPPSAVPGEGNGVCMYIQ
jgi:hypothetical protein